MAHTVFVILSPKAQFTPDSSGPEAETQSPRPHILLGPFKPYFKPWMITSYWDFFSKIKLQHYKRLISHQEQNRLMIYSNIIEIKDEKWAEKSLCVGGSWTRDLVLHCGERLFCLAFSSGLSAPCYSSWVVGGLLEAVAIFSWPGFEPGLFNGYPSKQQRLRA